MRNALLQDEDLRLDTLESFDVVDMPPDAALVEISRLAAQLCAVSSAGIAFVGEDRVWYKSSIGLSAEHTDRKHSPCAETVLGSDLHLIEDSANNALYATSGIKVGEESFRSFAGMPLIAPNGCAIGALCVFGRTPHNLTETQKASLLTLSHSVMTRLELLTRIRVMDTEARVRQRVETALTVERNFVSAVLDTAGALVVVMDTAGRVVRFNRACEEASGRTTSEIVGHYLWDRLLPEEDRAEAMQSIARIRGGEYPMSMLNRWKVRGGMRRIQWTATALLDPDGQVAFIIATGIDVTLQLAAEITLRESEARYRQLIEGSLGVVFTHTIDGKLTSLNAFGAESLGYRMEDMIGQPLEDFVPQEDREAIHAYVKEVLSTGNAQGTLRLVRKDGKTSYIAYRNRLMKPEGQLAYVLGFGVDITEKVEAEKKISALTQQSNSILDSVGDGIFAIDLKGKATIVNPAAAQMFGYRPQELLGKNIHRLVHHSHADGTPYAEKDSPINLLQGQETVRVSNEVFWRKDGTSFPVDYVACPIHQDKKITGIVVAFADTTERRALDRMKDEFISTVSHELRTPLTSMRASLGLIASGALASKPEKQKAMLDIAMGNTDRLVSLVNDILELERIGSGKAELHYTMCSAEDLMRRAASLQTGTAAKLGIEFLFEGDKVNVWADPDRILQTLTNLISNAIKFSQPGSSITLSAETVSEDEAILEVADEGRGIPADKLESIFERFQQVDASDSRAKGGTGLGLAICRSIVQQHGGRIWAESEMGIGSSFLLTLPTKPPQHLR